jgi:hypothetical protein
MTFIRWVSETDLSKQPHGPSFTRIVSLIFGLPSAFGHYASRRWVDAFSEQP